MATTEDLIAKSKAMVAQTTAQGTTPFAGSSFDTAPSNVADIKPIPDTKIPDTKSSLGDVSGAMSGDAGIQKLIELNIQQQQDQQKANEAQIAANDANSKNWLQQLTGTAKQAREDATTTTGINPTQYFAESQALITENKTLTDEYNKYKEALDTQIASLIGQGRGIPIDLLNNQAAQMERNAAPKLSYLSAKINSNSATLQSMQGRFNEAQTYIKQAIEDAVSPVKDAYNIWNDFDTKNATLKSSISDDLRSAWNNAINLAKTDYENARTEKTTIGNLMTKYYDAGISINDTLEEAYAKAAKSPSASLADRLAIQQEARLGTSDGTKASGTSGFTDVMQASIDQGATPEQAAREAAMASENTGIPVDQKTLAAWTEQARKLKKTPAPVAPVREQTLTAPTGKEVKSTSSTPWTISGFWNSLFN